MRYTKETIDLHSQAIIRAGAEALEELAKQYHTKLISKQTLQEIVSLYSNKHGIVDTRCYECIGDEISPEISKIIKKEVELQAVEKLVESNSK